MLEMSSWQHMEKQSEGGKIKGEGKRRGGEEKENVKVPGRENESIIIFYRWNWGPETQCHMTSQTAPRGNQTLWKEQHENAAYEWSGETQGSDSEEQPSTSVPQTLTLTVGLRQPQGNWEPSACCLSPQSMVFYHSSPRHLAILFNWWRNCWTMAAPVSFPHHRCLRRVPVWSHGVPLQPRSFSLCHTLSWVTSLHSLLELISSL